MSTRAALFIQRHDCQNWLEIYVHYDGMPRLMLPALQKANPSDLIAAREIRAIDEDGTVKGFAAPRLPKNVPEPRMPFWADHAYILTATGWQHFRTDSEARALIA